MNGYTLTQNWYLWGSNNLDKIKPAHSAIYFYAMHICNKLGWVEKFGFPTDRVMDMTGIANRRTYSKHLNDLSEWGFLRIIKKSPNRYQAAIVSLVYSTQLDTQLNTMLEHSYIHNNYTATARINKPNKPINKKTRETGLSALKFLENNCNEFMEFFKTEYGYKIKDKKSFAVKFNNKIVAEKIKHEPDVLMAQLENYAISWIKNEERFNNSPQEKSNRPNYF